MYMNDSLYDIIIDARMINHSGIGRFLREIIFRLSRSFKLFLILPHDGISYAVQYGLNYRLSQIPIYHPAEHFLFFRDSYKGKVFWSPHYNVPFFLFPGTKRVTTIHDLNHIVLSADLKFPRNVYAKILMRLALLLSNKIITVSDFTRSEINLNIPGYNKKIKVIHLGIKERGEVNIDFVRTKYSFPQKFMLFVGNVKPHKNIKVILQAMNLLPDEMLMNMPLVIVGEKEGFLTKDNTLNSLLMNPLLSKYVHFLGFIDDRDLDSVYAASSLFVFPSLYEGFGFPPLEAMQNNVPVLCSLTTSLPEVCGNAVTYFNPNDPQELAQKISDFISNPPNRLSISKVYEQHLRNFNWEECTEKYIQVFDNLTHSIPNQ